MTSKCRSILSALSCVSWDRTKAYTGDNQTKSHFFPGLDRPGGDLLFHTLRCSTIGAVAFHGRVRKGIGWFNDAITTRSTKLRNIMSLLSVPAAETDTKNPKIFVSLELRLMGSDKCRYRRQSRNNMTVVVPLSDFSSNMVGEINKLERAISTA